MSSSKFAHKHEIYDFIKPFLGEGLVSGSGQVYRMHRRIIQPMFSMKFCCDNLDVFQKHADECVEKLAQYVDGGETFDIQKIMHKCYANTVGGELNIYINNRLIDSLFDRILVSLITD